MRHGLLLLVMLLAGCMAPDAVPRPPAPGPLPPSLLLDRTANGTLQVYVHAKQGNVRYDFVNLTEFNDFEPNLTWSSETRPFARVYAVDLDLGVPAANLSVEVVEGSVRYHWQGRFRLNETQAPATLTVQTYDPDDGLGDPREFGLPYEKLLPRAREEAP